MDALTRAAERLHGAEAHFVGTVRVDERFQGEIVWQGLVSQFELRGHPSATKCYAWSVPATDTSKQKFYAVLHTPDVDSPEKAVRASIVADRKTLDH